MKRTAPAERISKGKTASAKEIHLNSCINRKTCKVPAASKGIAEQVSLSTNTCTVE